MPIVPKRLDSSAYVKIGFCAALLAPFAEPIGDGGRQQAASCSDSGLDAPGIDIADLGGGGS